LKEVFVNIFITFIVHNRHPDPFDKITKIPYNLQGGHIMMKNILFMAIALFLTQTGLVFAKNSPKAEISGIQVIQDTDCSGKDGIKVNVESITIDNLKGGSIQFVFDLKQNGKWLKGARLSLPEEKVLYESSEWKNSAETGDWYFCYPNTQLVELGDPAEPFTGYFIVMDTASGKELARASAEFAVKVKEPGTEGDKVTEEESMDGTASAKSGYSGVVIEWSYADGDSIKIENGNLVYQYVVSSTPQSMTSAIVMNEYEKKKAELTDQEIGKVLDLVAGSGWAKLKTGYGVAENERYYPETIRVKDPNGDKTVVFRSGQAAGTPRPGEFALIHDALKALVDKYFGKKTGN
jgi:hypothetical protein